ncbi:immediate early response 3-interacting protein 1-like [Forsythia ovata]|uniref:Immediate early response 3-interacting protein 1-like n=1 Tax=Forsythia ovata TaxID=205694 RepID=A0ABD1X839_9LAMI
MNCYMMQEMGLWTLLEGCLLLANTLAILNEDRLLAPRGWSFQEFSGVKRKSFKGQIIGLIYAVHWFLDDVHWDVSKSKGPFCLSEKKRTFIEKALFSASQPHSPDTE